MLNDYAALTTYWKLKLCKI